MSNVPSFFTIFVYQNHMTGSLVFNSLALRNYMQMIYVVSNWEVRTAAMLFVHFRYNLTQNS
jgi:hypothetical protein